MSLDPEDREKLNQLSDEKYQELIRKSHDALNKLISRTSGMRSQPLVGPLPVGYHGRWDMLSVEDVKFLIAVGIKID